jgi:hypothetical protein
MVCAFDNKRKSTRRRIGGSQPAMDQVVSVEARIQELCNQILTENEPAKLEELFASLRNIVQASQQDTRQRLRYAVKRYQEQVRRPQGLDSAATKSANERASRIRQLLAFLGLAQEPTGRTLT